MNKILFLILSSFTLLFNADAQVFRPMTARYNNPSVKGNIVYVSNNSVTTPAAITTEAPPGGTATNNNNPGAYLDIDVDVPAHTVKFPFGSVWNYHSQGVAPANNPAPTDWKQPAYVMNPATWNSLLTAIPSIFILPPFPGKYGFSNPANASIITCLKSNAAPVTCTPAAGVKYTAYYFRKTVNFTALELAAYSSIMINMRRNDGVVVYINGVERIRTNMPGGVIGYGTLATAAIAMGAAENYTCNLNPAFFVAGVNTIAVEIHLNVNNATNMSFDMQMLGIDNNASFSSTSANLNLNSCSQILWAGLYWGANHQSGVGSDTAWIKQEDTVKLRVPGSPTYQIITSTQNDYHNSTRLAGLNHAGYFCYADITSLINLSNPNGTYTVADIVAPVGFNSCGAGWTIAIAYANPTEIQRNITIFDGSAVVKIASPNLFVPITGFLTPPVGPVSCELGVVAYDGDRGTPGLLDNFYFKQDANPLVGVYTNMTPNATSNLNDMFNSTISNKGVVSLARNPAHLNTLGYDADIIEIPNPGNVLLGNSQTSASIRLSSTVEDFFVQVITTAVSIYNPSFAFDKTSTDLSGGSLTPGDSLRYQLNYNNVGNDASTNSRITDNIPAGTIYKPGSIMINGVSKTDIAGDDEAEYDFTNNRVVFRLGTGANAVTGGEIAPGSSGNVTFEVYMPSSCAVLSCGATMRNRARMSYGGKLSLLALQDSSGVLNAGCIDPVDKIDIVTGACTSVDDTILANICPSLSVMLPIAKYAGYSFHSGIPFTGANRYDPSIPVTYTRIIYAYYDAPGVCTDDTARINIFITACPDIDDDNDGIPDYVEINDPLAWGNHDGDANLNWNDAQYPGYIDNNGDAFNDNFDPSADSDNDGIPNFIDNNFPGFVDTNGDGLNDNMDKDLDGIPNHLDLDSDNDGIPDTVESFGVDANGDGRIDNYSDTDNDGLSQNVDANNTGVTNSGLALGPLDTDGDGIPNYLDLDSDNDGIPDIVEAFGTDAGNNGKVDGFTDVDGDGFSDNVDGDIGNDSFCENSFACLLLTSADGNGDGRLDSWPYKNMDNDSKSSPYDLDSDGDGIADVREAQFTDANFDGSVDGALNTDGWNAALAALGSLSLPNTDGVGRVNVYDIDSDEDGIPDNVEGMSTAGYLLPAAVDTDADGLDNRYDNFAGFGGNGINPFNLDGDANPDYLDNDTDGDGVIDRMEGNDLNLNGLLDDNVTLTGIDTDADGLDDRFDNNNSSPEGTSAYMGDGGSMIGDPTPGSITTVQRTPSLWCGTERDWRCVYFVLSCDIISFKASLQNRDANLEWTVLCDQEVDHFVIERSLDGTNFTALHSIAGVPGANRSITYYDRDNLGSVTKSVVYYRLIIYTANGKTSVSNIISLKLISFNHNYVEIAPNPVKTGLQLLISVVKATKADIYIYDAGGQVVDKFKETLQPGSVTLNYNSTEKLPNGVYYLHVYLDGESIKRKFSKIK